MDLWKLLKYIYLVARYVNLKLKPRLPEGRKQFKQVRAKQCLQLAQTRNKQTNKQKINKDEVVFY